ncbi:branched-chain amino acid ABC transporter permease [Leucobacter sp.]
MDQFLTYLLTGIAVGSSYALLGVGYVVVHRTTRIVNFAQGVAPVFAGLACAALVSAGLPRGVTELIAVLGAAIVSVLIGLLAMAARTSLAALLVTLGAGVGFYAINILIFGSTPQSFSGIPGYLSVFGARLQTQYLFVAVATLVVFGLLWWFFHRTYLGKGLTAAAANPFAAQLQGISIRRSGLIAFAIAGAVGGIAGVLITPLQPVAFSSDIAFAIYGFAAAVFGGLNKVGPALWGGVLLGVAQALIGGYLGTENQLSGALVIVLIVMIVQAGRRRTITEEVV